MTLRPVCTVLLLLTPALVQAQSPIELASHYEPSPLLYRLPSVTDTADPWDAPLLNESATAPTTGNELTDAAVEEPAEKSFWSLWDGSVEFGMNGTHGNSETFNLRFGTRLERKSERMTETYELTHVDKSNGAKTIARNALLEGRVEWNLAESPWTYFLHSLSEYDEFKTFDVRANVDSGLGYHFIDSDAGTLIGRLGGSVSREFGGPMNVYVPEVTTGFEWKYRIDDRQNVAAKLEYFPDITKPGQYRINSRAEWENVVAPDWGLSLKLSAIDRYDSTPNGARQNDLDYSLLLLWNF